MGPVRYTRRFKTSHGRDFVRNQVKYDSFLASISFLGLFFKLQLLQLAVVREI